MGCSFRKRKPNKIWVDKGSQFSNSSFKKWLEDNEIRMYSTFNEKKFVVAEIFIRTYKKRFTSIRQTLQKCVNVLNDTVDKYSNAYHNTIKMKPIDVKSNYYTEYDVDSNEKDPKFQVGDHARISKYKNIFAKGYAPNLSEEVFVISNIKNTVPWNYVINDLNGDEIIGTFYEK